MCISIEKYDKVVKDLKNIDFRSKFREDWLGIDLAILGFVGIRRSRQGVSKWGSGSTSQFLG